MRILPNLAALVLTATQVSALEAEPRLSPGILVGDRLLNVAAHLGIAPQAYSIRETGSALDLELKRAGSLPLGTPASLIDENPCAVLVGLLETEAPRIVVEQSAPFDSADPAQDPQRLMPLLTQADLVKQMGTTVATVDFTIGADLAIFQIGEIFDRRAEAATLLDAREAQLARVDAMLPLDRPLRAVVLHGADDGAPAPVAMETAGGPTDLALLRRIGVEMAGSPKPQTDDNASLPVDWRAIVVAAPDVMIVTGDATRVRDALDHAMNAEPALADIPAVKADAILSLPVHSEMNIVGYPEILETWTLALSKVAKRMALP